MCTTYIFTDGSCNTQNKTGVGSCLIVEDLSQPIKLLEKSVKCKRFENTSSTKLELETFLWAISLVEPSNKIKAFTDSQNLKGLLERRLKLEKNNFISKNGKVLKNAKLYQQFFEICDLYDIEFIKVKGHNRKHIKDYIDHIFTIVDRVSRKVLRNSANNL